MLRKFAVGFRAEASRSETGLVAPLTSIGGARWSTYTVIFASALAYLMAKHVITGGHVTLDQVEYWLLGLAAIAILIYAGRLIRPQEERTGGTRASLLLLCCWMCSLVCFVALRTSYYSEGFEFPVYRALDYNPFLSNAAVALIYALAGTTIAIAATWMLERKFPVRALAAMCSVFLNFALFFALVFAV